MHLYAGLSLEKKKEKEISARKRCINDPFYGSAFLNGSPYLECNLSQYIKTENTKGKKKVQR